MHAATPRLRHLPVMHPPYVYFGMPVFQHACTHTCNHPQVAATSGEASNLSISATARGEGVEGKENGSATPFSSSLFPIATSKLTTATKSAPPASAPATPAAASTPTRTPIAAAAATRSNPQESFAHIFSYTQHNPPHSQHQRSLAHPHSPAAAAAAAAATAAAVATAEAKSERLPRPLHPPPLHASASAGDAALDGVVARVRQQVYVGSPKCAGAGAVGGVGGKGVQYGWVSTPKHAAAAAAAAAGGGVGGRDGGPNCVGGQVGREFNLPASQEQCSAHAPPNATLAHNNSNISSRGYGYPRPARVVEVCSLVHLAPGCVWGAVWVVVFVWGAYIWGAYGVLCGLWRLFQVRVRCYVVIVSGTSEVLCGFR